ncbi:hypothetical protein LN042_06835 [Kitasatospora sp. RB6PN24]|uniref:hypothetical protein n=1 Tax=Kitasatospora humi TaxID=2893891 RepID=UPI001E47A574|nr:hypothetical protein [Kitasatospora humi]MCC9306821.1 hypothetical protein [Kitasatospora humi]
MAVRRRRGSAAALALTAALSVGSTLLLTACGPDGAAPSAASSPAATLTATEPAASSPAAVPSATATPSAPGAQTPAAGSTPTGNGTTPRPSATRTGAPAPGGSATPSGPGAPTRGTGTPHLTISNGTNLVQMPDSVVDFHTRVRDLAWAPDGSRAVFVNGNGDLVTAKPDGTDQIVAAKNPGGQTWSHPTWMMTMPDPQIGLPNRDTIIFTADRGGTTKLMQVRGDAVNGTPTVLPLSAGAPGDNGPVTLPQTANTWANVGGTHGSIAYENTADGSVYIRDDYTRQQGYKLTEGSEPALSPDGNEVVFVRSVGGHDHLFEVRLGQNTITPQDLTPGATTDYTEPAFSPDGKEVTVRTPNGTAAMPADGELLPHPGGAAMPGLPAYRP